MTRLRDEEPVGRAIAEIDVPRARDEFRADLRRALLATAASEWSAAPRRAETRRRFALPSLAPAPRFALAFAVLVFAVLGTGGIAAASSLPGDAAYALKIAYEQVEITLASDDAGKVQVLARQADRRLDELNEVSNSRPQQAPTASSAYQEALVKFEAALATLKDASPSEKNDAAVDVAAAAAEKHIAILEALRARHDTPGLERALDQAKDIEREAKDKQDERRQERDRERNETFRPNVTARPARTESPRATPRPTPKPAFTPRIDDPDPRDY